MSIIHISIAENKKKRTFAKATTNGIRKILKARREYVNITSNQRPIKNWNISEKIVRMTGIYNSVYVHTP